VPNLLTDRGIGVARAASRLNVRRLMYQPLIWAAVLGDDPCGLGTTLDTKDSERLANSLVDRVRRDSELGRDFLGAQMLIDEAKAVELTGREASDTLGHRIVN